MLWGSGGLDLYNYASWTQLKYSETRGTFFVGYWGPSLPQPRILHCMVMINKTHAFLHGGKTPLEPFKKHDPPFYKRNMRIGPQNVYRTFDGIANLTATQSYLFNLENKEWTKVSNQAQYHFLGVFSQLHTCLF